MDIWQGMGPLWKYFFILTDLCDEYDRDRDSGSVMPEPGGGHCPPSQYLADQLTLFQPGEGRLIINKGGGSNTYLVGKFSQKEQEILNAY